MLEDLQPVQARASRTDVSLLDRQQAFGYTQEDLKLLLQPMAVTGQEAVGSMGTDTPISALSDKPKLLYTYFKQNFAQVTNPPIDPIREELVMSLVSFIGPRPNILDLEGTSRAQAPGSAPADPDQRGPGEDPLRSAMSRIGSTPRRSTSPIRPSRAPPACDGALDRLCDRAEAAVHGGYNIIILSDRAVGPDRIPIPALLATAAVHNYLIRKGLRTSVGLVVEIGRAARGASFRLPCRLRRRGDQSVSRLRDAARHAADEMPPEVDEDEIVNRYIKSIDKGLLKVMSKMGISTYQSYCGAQIFDAVGLRPTSSTAYFFGTATTIEGVGMAEIARGDGAPPPRRLRRCAGLPHALDVGGEYAYRLRGEDHAWTPGHGRDAAARGARSTRRSTTATTRACVNEQENQLHDASAACSASRLAEELGRAPVPLEEVEPAAEIVQALRHRARCRSARSRARRTRRWPSR